MDQFELNKSCAVVDLENNELKENNKVDNFFLKNNKKIKKEFKVKMEHFSKYLFVYYLFKLVLFLEKI